MSKGRGKKQPSLCYALYRQGNHWPLLRLLAWRKCAQSSVQILHTLPWSKDRTLGSSFPSYMTSLWSLRHSLGTLLWWGACREGSGETTVPTVVAEQGGWVAQAGECEHTWKQQQDTGRRAGVDQVGGDVNAMGKDHHTRRGWGEQGGGRQELQRGQRGLWVVMERWERASKGDLCIPEGFLSPRHWGKT